MIYYTADLHFGHTNVISMSKRPFKDIDEKDNTYKYLLERNKYVELHINTESVLDPKSTEDNMITVQALSGSEMAPFVTTLKTDSSKVGVCLEDSEGNRIKNQAVNIFSYKTRETYNITSDEYGIAWIETEKVSPKFIAELDNYEIYISNCANGALVCVFPFIAIDKDLDNTIIFKGIVDKVPAVQDSF